MSCAACGSIVKAMTETTVPPAPAAAARPLYRDPDDKMLAGVNAALARYTNTDPVIWRITTVVLAIFGGTGIALYVLGWVLIPKLGQDRSLAESWLHRREGSRMSLKTVALIALVVVIVVGGLDDGRGVAAAAVIAVVGYLVYRERQGDPVVPSFGGTSTPPPAYADAPATAAPVTAAAAAEPTWIAPPPPVRAPKERSGLGQLTVSIAAIVSGGLVWAGLAGADSITAGRVLAVALVVVSLGLIVGTWFGRARWLIAVGLLLSLGLGAAMAADAGGVTLRGGVGERTWVVGEGTTSPSYRLGIGEATLDLTRLPNDGRHVVVRGTVSLGHLIVLVPDDVPMRLHATVKVGELTEFGDSLVSGSSKMERTRSYGPAGDPRVEIEATVGTGQIEVRHG